VRQTKLASFLVNFRAHYKIVGLYCTHLPTYLFATRVTLNMMQFGSTSVPSGRRSNSSQRVGWFGGALKLKYQHLCSWNVHLYEQIWASSSDQCTVVGGPTPHSSGPSGGSKTGRNWSTAVDMSSAATRKRKAKNKARNSAANVDGAMVDLWNVCCEQDHQVLRLRVLNDLILCRVGR